MFAFLLSNSNTVTAVHIYSVSLSIVSLTLKTNVIYFFLMHTCLIGKGRGEENGVLDESGRTI